MTAQHWPDGQPVTPWADPWHDVAADLREIAAAAHAAWPGPPPVVLLPCDGCGEMKPHGPGWLFTPDGIYCPEHQT